MPRYDLGINRERRNGMDFELPKTEQELNDLIEARVKAKEDEMTSRHNGAMASTRKKYEDEIAKLKQEAGISAEKIAEEKIKEQQEADRKELEELRSFKKTSELSSRLSKEGLPEYFKNDTRLLNADSTSIDKVIKDVKKEYEATLPKGATHSTVVPINGQAPARDTTTEVYSAVGEAIKNALG